jgi:hypothetical protein
MITRKTMRKATTTKRRKDWGLRTVRRAKDGDGVLKTGIAVKRGEMDSGCGKCVRDLDFSPWATAAVVECRTRSRKGSDHSSRF